MILSVCPNPAWDLTWSLERLQRGETLRVSPASSRAGGKAVNVARVLHARGHHTSVIAPLGGDGRSLFENDLRRAGIAYTAVPSRAQLRLTAAVVETATSEVTLLTEPGGPLSDDESAALVAAVTAQLPHTAALVISGSLPAGIGPEFVTTLVHAAHARGVPVVADLQGDALRAAASAGADAVKPNRAELAAAVGHSRLLDGMNELLECGAGTVFCSLGADGLVSADGCSAPRRGWLDGPLTGNATGAGDAAVAAIAAGLAGGVTDPQHLLRAACAWSAAAVAAPAAGDSDAALSERLALRVHIDSIDARFPEELP